MDEEQPVWNDVVRRAIEIAHDAHPSDLLREVCGPLLNWKEIADADIPEKEFHRQLAAILCADLDHFREWANKEQGPVAMRDEEGLTRIVLEREGSTITVRGPFYPHDREEWLSPFWVVVRLMESGLIHDLCWDPVSLPEAA